MTGSHRGESSRRTPRRVLALLAVVLTVAAAVVLVGLRGDDEPTTAADRPRPTPSATSSPTPTPTPTSTPTPAPPAAPTTAPPRPDLPTLAPASPRRLVIAGLIDAGFDDSIEPDGDRFRTRSTAELSRWGSRAVPASPGAGTVFVAGRVAADGESGFGALPRVRTGARVELRTDAGVLTYTVRTVTTRDEAGFTRSPLVTKQVPGRLVLIGIRYTASGSATTTYVVVTADLTAVARG